MDDSLILVLAKIKEERGIQGNLKIIRRGDMMDRFKKKSTIKLYSASAIKDGFLIQPDFIGEFTLLNLEPLTGETAEIKLAEILTREDAAKLSGFFIGLELSEARKKFHDPDDPYLFEYIHCDVFEDNKKMGRVIRVEEFNYRQWLIVQSNQKEIMIPLQGPFVQDVNLAEARINLVEGNGLFEFDETA